MPCLGVMHHIGYRKHRRRGLFSHVHIWLGRIGITLGIVNGGLGLYIASNASRGRLAAYGVVAGVIWLTWFFVAILGEVFRTRRSRGPRPVGAAAPPEKGGYHNRPEFEIV